MSLSIARQTTQLPKVMKPQFGNTDLSLDADFFSPGLDLGRDSLDITSQSSDERLTVEYQMHLDEHGVRGHKQLMDGLKKTKKLLELYPEAKVDIKLLDHEVGGKKQTAGYIVVQLKDGTHLKTQVKNKESASLSDGFQSQRAFMRHLNRALANLLSGHFEMRYGAKKWAGDTWDDFKEWLGTL